MRLLPSRRPDRVASLAFTYRRAYENARRPVGYLFGSALGGIRTHTPKGQRLLTPPRLPITPPVHWRGRSGRPPAAPLLYVSTAPCGFEKFTPCSRLAVEERPAVQCPRTDSNRRHPRSKRGDLPLIYEGMRANGGSRTLTPFRAPRSEHGVSAISPRWRVLHFLTATFNDLPRSSSISLTKTRVLTMPISLRGQRSISFCNL